MGALLTRLRSPVSHFATYERTLKRLDEESHRLQNVKQRQHIFVTQAKNIVKAFAFLSVALAASYAAWVQRQPAGTFLLHQHFVRVAPIFVLPGVFWLLLHGVTAFFNWRVVRTNARLKKLEDAKRKLIKELKDITRFDKTQQLINQYDPDYQVQTPVPKARPDVAGTPLSLRGVSCPPVKGYNLTPTSVLLRNAGGAATAAAVAAAGAGRALLPVLQTVANSLVGDNPALLHHIREVQQRVLDAEVKAQAAAAENEALRRENQLLHAQLSNLGYQPGNQVPNDAPNDRRVIELNPDTAEGGSHQIDQDNVTDAGIQISAGIGTPARVTLVCNLDDHLAATPTVAPVAATS